MGAKQSIPICVGPKPIVIVLGGGYGGVLSSTTLDATNRFFVILIDRKDHFYNNIASLRAGVDNATAMHTLIPYNKLLKNGIVLQADIVNVTATNVTVHGHPTPIAFDYLVIATGSSYSSPSPSRVNDRTLAVAMTRFVNFRTRAALSKDVVVVGGGSVGIELAAEMKETYPNTNVTLVHAGTRLLHAEPRLKDEFISRAMKQLDELGVVVMLNDRVSTHVGDDGDATAVSGLGTITTTIGNKQIPCDLLLYTGGAATNTNSLTSTFGDVMVNGRLSINEYMQVEGYTNIFAVGDVAGTEPKRASYAGKQGAIAGSNIDIMHLNAQPSAQIAPLRSWVGQIKGYGLVLPIGHGGVSQVYYKNEPVYGKFVTRYLKSGDLFAERMYDELNQSSLLKSIHNGKHADVLTRSKLNIDVDHVDNVANIASLATILGINVDDAKLVLTTGMTPFEVIDGQLNV